MSYVQPEDLPECVKEPCNDCPWRRNATAGWLGPHDANKWSEIAHGESAIACHQTIEVDESWEGTKQCRGAAIFRRNIFKQPRNPRIEVGPEDHTRVFSSSLEFIEYHEGAAGLEIFYEAHPWLRP